MAFTKSTAAISDMTDMASCNHLPRAMPRLSVREGLLRYRNDRDGILAELGDRGVDMIDTKLGSIRLVYITEANLAHQALVTHNDAFTKGPAVGKHLVKVLGNGLLTSHGEDHRAQRKALAPKFSPRHIAQFIQTKIELTEAMLDRWRNQECEDFDSEMNTLTMLIAARTMFGAAMTAEDLNTISEGVTLANHWVIKQSMSLLRAPSWMPTPDNRRIQRALKRMDNVVYRLIQEHRERPAAFDVLNALLMARDDEGRGMDDTLVRDQVLTFFLAGHETASTTMSWAYRILCEHPEVMERIKDEADMIFKADRPDVRKLEFTRAAVQEIMRIRPPAYVIGRQAREDLTVGDYQINAGDYMAVNVLGIHRRADYFEEPLSFRPERFLSEPAWPRAAYIPFGVGPRVCIGNHFAMQELMIVLALMCKSVKFNAEIEKSTSYCGFDAEPLVTMRPVGELPSPTDFR